MGGSFVPGRQYYTGTILPRQLCTGIILPPGSIVLGAVMFLYTGQGGLLGARNHTVFHTIKLNITGICPHHQVKHHWYMSTPKQPAKEANPGTSEHESYFLCVSPPSEDDYV